MPPALHPRSVFTTSLFTTTLALSFVVVGLPHIIPCPVDSRQYADGQLNGLHHDSQGRQRKRRKPVKDTQSQDSHGVANSASQPIVKQITRESATPNPAQTSKGTQEEEHDSISKRRTRECPVPKPGGLVGQILGFNSQQPDQATKPNVRIKSARENSNDSQHTSR